MFGFGKSAHQKAAVNLFALQFEALGLPEATAIAQGTALIDEVLSEIMPRGIDPFKAHGNNCPAPELGQASRTESCL